MVFSRKTPLFLTQIQHATRVLKSIRIMRDFIVIFTSLILTNESWKKCRQLHFLSLNFSWMKCTKISLFLPLNTTDWDTRKLKFSTSLNSLLSWSEMKKMEQSSPFLSWVQSKERHHKNVGLNKLLSWLGMQTSRIDLNFGLIELNFDLVLSSSNSKSTSKK